MRFSIDRRCVIHAALAITILHAGAAEPIHRYVLGIELGSPAGRYPDCDTPAAADKICTHPFGNNVLSIELRPDRPKFLTTNMLAVVHDGHISSLSAATSGLESQEEVLALLTRELGKPTSLKRQSVHNAFNAQYGAITASWEFPELIVDFRGIKDQLDAGEVMATTVR